MSEGDANPRRLIPLAKFDQYHPDPSPAALRWLLFTNRGDFKRCVVRRGRRILIDEGLYFAWLAEQNTQLPEALKKGPAALKATL